MKKPHNHSGDENKCKVEEFKMNLKRRIEESHNRALLMPFVLVVILCISSIGDGYNGWLLYSREGENHLDCFKIENVDYCRNSITVANCSNNVEKIWHYSDLIHMNDSERYLLDKLSIPLHIIQSYAKYSKSSTNETDNIICQCSTRYIGASCEYQLPPEGTPENVLHQQLSIKPQDRFYSVPICYDDVKCDNVRVCIDWRNICDGIPQCEDASDEKDCDKLEFNICNSKEYRCRNGMCIPTDFIFDGEFDC
ncbi:unnamed protein product, partial [Didymodactylos carnosus]